MSETDITDTEDTEINSTISSQNSTHCQDKEEEEDFGNNSCFSPRIKLQCLGIKEDIKNNVKKLSGGSVMNVNRERIRVDKVDDMFENVAIHPAGFGTAADSCLELNETFHPYTEIIKRNIAINASKGKDVVEIVNIDKVNETIDKVQVAKAIKCERCDFACDRNQDLSAHKETSHNWCTICFSSFTSQGKLRKHRKKMHKK